MRHPHSSTSLTKGVRAVVCLTLIGGIVNGRPVSCLAQKPEASQVEFDPSAKLPMDIMKGTQPATMSDTRFVGEETETFVAISTGPSVGSSEAVPIDAKESVPLSKRMLSQIDLLTTQLVSQSRDAWLRGLMDQASYAAWLDVASTSQLRIAASQGDRDRALIVLREQVALWTEAANELEAFNQPAARGWEADLSHSRVMALRAQLRFAVAAGRPLMVEDQQAYSQLAAEHLDLRLQDFRLGTGTAASVLDAAKMLDEQIVAPQQSNETAGSRAAMTIPEVQIERPVTILAALAEVRRPAHLEAYPFATRDFAEDRRAVRRASTLATIANTPAAARDSDRFLSELDQHAEAIVANQFARFQAGTATPAGMLREWWLQETLAGALGQDLSDSAFYTAQTRRLEAIHQVAMTTSDLRGRNAADVAAAEMLVAMRQLDLRPSSVARPAAPDNQPVATPQAQVIEYPKKVSADRGE